HLSPKIHSEDSAAEWRRRKTEPYSCRGCSDYANIFKSSDVSMSRSHCYCLLVPSATTVPIPVISAGSPSSTTIDQDAPFISYSPSSSELQPPASPQGAAVGSIIMEANPFTPADNEPFVNIFDPDTSSKASSSGEITISESNQSTQPYEHL
ncbi:hypothetical protein Tco_1149282, partial [Tanacetum coccineum]